MKQVVVSSPVHDLTGVQLRQRLCQKLDGVVCQRGVSLHGGIGIWYGMNIINLVLILYQQHIDMSPKCSRAFLKVSKEKNP